MYAESKSQRTDFIRLSLDIIVGRLINIRRDVLSLIQNQETCVQEVYLFGKNIVGESSNFEIKQTICFKNRQLVIVQHYDYVLRNSSFSEWASDPSIHPYLA